MKQIRLALIAVVLLISGCHCNSSYNNREQDIEEAKTFGTQFYNVLQKKDFKSTYPLFSKKFYEVTDTPALQDIYDTSFALLGDIVDVQVVHCETVTVRGTDSRSEYQLVYKVKRTKFDSEERVGLLKISNNVKIVSYFVNSDGFKGANKDASKKAND